MNLFKKWGGYDHNRPRANNTTNVTAMQRFGLAKDNTCIQDKYTELLHDYQFICNALVNKKNRPKHIPALWQLVRLHVAKHSAADDYRVSRVVDFQKELLYIQLKEMSIKLYKYYFKDIEKPIIIEAITKQSANDMLESVMSQVAAKGYMLENLIDCRVETPISGQTKKKHEGKEYTWTDSGWALTI